MRREAARGPLDGIRVVELGMMIVGPFAGRILADLGADVIKVERPGRGDPLRDWKYGDLLGIPDEELERLRVAGAV